MSSWHCGCYGNPGDGDGLRVSPKCPEGLGKSFQRTNYTLPKTTFSLKYAMKKFPDLDYVRVPNGDGPIILVSGSRSKMDAYHIEH